ncbi:MAG: TonB-dependent receptor [Bradymonadia bacterium]
MKRALSAFAALSSVLLWAVLATAQPYGRIAGTAEDVNGGPVPGVKVTLSSRALIGGDRSLLTDAGGQFQFVNLPVGEYAVRGEARGFRTQVQTGLRVALGETTDVVFLMETDAEEQVVEVRAERPLIDMRKTHVGTSLTREFLEDVPSARDYQGTAQFLPGVSGGGNPNIHGGSEYSNQYYVDGINTTDPNTNTFSLNFNFDAIEEVEVITAGLSPEYGNTSGGVINLVTKSGSNEFELDSSFYVRNDALTMNDLDGTPRDFSSYQGNLNVGGPILKDHLWYYVSAEYNRSTSQLSDASPVPALAGVRHAPREYESLYWLAKLTFAPDAQNKFTLLLQSDPTTISNSLQDPTVANEAEEHQDQGGILASLRWDGIFDPIVAKLQGAYKLSILDIFPERRATSSSPFKVPGVFGFGRLSDKNDFGVVRGCVPAEARADGLSGENCTQNIFDDPQFGQGSTFDLDTGATTGGSGTDVYIERTRIEINPAISYFLKGKGGDHEFKLGSDISLLNDSERSSYPGGASIFVAADTDGDGEAEILRARAASTDDNDFTAKNSARVIAVYALDNWNIADRVQLQPGVRVEKSSYDFYEGKPDALSNPAFEFTVVSPRFSFSVDAFGDRRTRVYGGYGKLYETGNLVLSKFVGKSIENRRVVYGECAEGEDLLACEDLDNVQATGGSNGTAIDKGDLDPLEVDEWHLGLEHALTERLSLGLMYIRRTTTNAWEDDERNLVWNQAGTDIIGSIDGTGTQTYTLRNTDAERNYEAVELTLFRRMADHWMLNGSYTLSWYTGTSTELLTGAYDNPRQNVYLDGPLPEDHRHMLKAQFVYKWDSGLSVGGRYRFESGGPYSKLFLNTYDGDYTNRRAPRGKDPGLDPNDPEDDKNLRLPDLTVLDLRVAYDFGPVSGQDLELYADVFNALNLQAVTSVEGNQTEANNFGQPTGRQDPFQVQLGARYRY